MKLVVQSGTHDLVLEDRLEWKLWASPSHAIWAYKGWSYDSVLLSGGQVVDKNSSSTPRPKEHT